MSANINQNEHNSSAISSFQKLRNKFPQNIEQSSMKVELVFQWILKEHKYRLLRIINQSRNQQKNLHIQQKALDQSQQAVNAQFTKCILQSVKQVIGCLEQKRQADEKYQGQQAQKAQICSKFQLAFVESIVEKVQVNLKVTSAKGDICKAPSVNKNREINEQQSEQLQKKSKTNQQKEKNNMSDLQLQLQLQQKVNPPQIKDSSKNKENSAKSNSTQKKLRQDPNKPTPAQSKKPTNNKLVVTQEILLSEANIFANNLTQANMKRENQQNIQQQKRTDMLNEPSLSVLNEIPSDKKNEQSLTKPKQNRQQSDPIPINERKQNNIKQHSPQYENNSNRFYVKSQIQSYSDFNSKEKQSQKNFQNEKNYHKQSKYINVTTLPQKNQNQSIPVINTKSQVSSYIRQQQRFSNNYLAKSKPKSHIDSIFANPYIKKTFTYLCKQNYIGGGKTFEQIAQSSQTMTLNKWIVFCKQFGFTKDLKHKVLVDIFHETNDFMAQMHMENFLKALVAVKIRLKVEQSDFIRKNMELVSENSFRDKVASFKVNYSGAKYNCFEQARRLPIDRYFQQKKQEKFLNDRIKQREHVPHQGKFKQQINQELLQRRKLKVLKRSRNLQYSEALPSVMEKSSTTKVRADSNKKVSSSMSNSNSMAGLNFSPNPTRNPSSQLSHYTNSKHSVEKKGNIHSEQGGQSPVKNKQALAELQYLKRRMKPMTYSSIFSHKNQEERTNFPRIRKTKNKQSDASTNVENSNSTVFEHKGFSPIPINNHSMVVRKSIRPNYQSSKDKNQSKKLNIQDYSKNVTERIEITKQKQKQSGFFEQIKPTRQWQQPSRQPNFERQDSQESDQILKEHLQNQKQMNFKIPQPIQLSRVIKAYKHEKKWLYNDQECDREAQAQTQMAITKNLYERFN